MANGPGRDQKLGTWLVLMGGKVTKKIRVLLHIYHYAYSLQIILFKVIKMSTTANLNTNIKSHEISNIEEFILKTQCDGEILITDKEIIKKKPVHTVDLRYLKDDDIFLDNDNIVYSYKKI